MPKIIDKKVKKFEILGAAMKIFAQKGVANTKMVDIAVAAGIGKGTIYEYFSNKDEIFNLAFQHFMDTIGASISKEIMKVTEPVEKLRAIFFAWVDVIERDHPDLIEIMLDFWADAVRRKDEADMSIINLEKMYAEFRQMIQAILDEGIRLGKFRPVNTFITASLLLGTIDGVMLQWILDKNIFQLRTAIECFLDEFLYGICIKQ